MREMHYDLFLDESGNFDPQSPPSLVGGFFCPAGLLTEELAQVLLRESFAEADRSFPANGQVHGTELPKEALPAIVRRLIDKLLVRGVQPLIFENQERVEIVDPDTTYIHLMAEGVTRFFSLLSSAGSKTKLTVTAARRVSEDPKYQAALRVIPQEEYLQAIQTGLATSMLRLGVSEYGEKWSLAEFRLGSAREEYRLMIADLICNAWFSRYSRFDQKDRAWLEDVLGSNHFIVVEHGVLATLARKRAEGAYGEALFTALAELDPKPNSADKKRLASRLEQEIGRLVELLAGMPRFGLRRHLDALLVQVEYLITVERDYGQAERLLGEIRSRVLNPLRERLGSGFAGLDWANLRIASHLLAIGNHQGRVHTLDELLVSADASLSQLAQRFENLDLVLSYLNRKTVYLNNSYGFGSALQQIERLIQFHEGMMSLYPVELPQLFENGLKSEVLGKLYGSKVQTLTFLARNDPGYYASAREASLRAMDEFESPEDLARQHLYRCQLEADAGEYHVAWEHLVRGTIHKAQELSPTELAAYLSGDRGRMVFAVAHYCRLMAACALSDDPLAQDFARELGEAWENHNLEAYPPLQNRFAEHPIEIIRWKVGTYYLIGNQIKRGRAWQEKALNICFRDQDRLTMYTIGLAILVEQAGILWKLESKYYTEVMERARKQVDKFLSFRHLPRTMKMYFDHWPRVLKQVQSGEELLALAREVPY